MNRHIDTAWILSFIIIVFASHCILISATGPKSAFDAPQAPSNMPPVVPGSASVPTDIAHPTSASSKRHAADDLNSNGKRRALLGESSAPSALMLSNVPPVPSVQPAHLLKELNLRLDVIMGMSDFNEVAAIAESTVADYKTLVAAWESAQPPPALLFPACFAAKHAKYMGLCAMNLIKLESDHASLFGPGAISVDFKKILNAALFVSETHPDLLKHLFLKRPGIIHTPLGFDSTWSLKIVLGLERVATTYPGEILFTPASFSILVCATAERFLKAVPFDDAVVNTLMNILHGYLNFSQRFIQNKNPLPHLIPNVDDSTVFPTLSTFDFSQPLTTCIQQHPSFSSVFFGLLNAIRSRLPNWMINDLARTTYMLYPRALNGASLTDILFVLTLSPHATAEYVYNELVKGYLAKGWSNYEIVFAHNVQMHVTVLNFEVQAKILNYLRAHPKYDAMAKWLHNWLLYNGPLCLEYQKTDKINR